MSKETTKFKIGNWTDSPCYYVDCIDGPKVAMIAGPFKTKEEAKLMLDPARDLGCKVDPKAWFYNWGTCKRVNGYRQGILNRQLNI